MKKKNVEFPAIKTKVCSRCGKRKAVKNFYRDSYQKDGYKSACKECVKEARQ